MIRSRENGTTVAREQPDSRGLGDVLERAADGGPAEAELQRQEGERRHAESYRTWRATRTLFVDAMYRAKQLNGDAAFDMGDMENLENLLLVADGITQRRSAREHDPVAYPVARGSDAP
jgi:hypothetical protein